jgi:hypothetical protein
MQARKEINRTPHRLRLGGFKSLLRDYHPFSQWSRLKRCAVSLPELPQLAAQGIQDDLPQAGQTAIPGTSFERRVLIRSKTHVKRAASTCRRRRRMLNDPTLVTLWETRIRVSDPVVEKMAIPHSLQR